MATKEWLDEIGDAVANVTKGFERQDRKYAFDYLRNHIKVDELHQFAIRKFKGKVIEFGDGSLSPIVVVLTKEPITMEQKSILMKAWEKLGIPEDEVYYAYLRFVKTKQKQDVRQEILNQLVNILKPKFVLAFDGVTVNTKIDRYETRDPVTILTDRSKKEERVNMMQALRDID